MQIDTQFDVGEEVYVLRYQLTGYAACGPFVIHKITTETKSVPSALTSVTISYFYEVDGLSGKYFQTDLFRNKVMAQGYAQRRNVDSGHGYIHPWMRVRVKRVEFERISSALGKWWRATGWLPMFNVTEQTIRPAFTDDRDREVPEVRLHRTVTIDDEGVISTTEGGRHVPTSLHDLHHLTDEVHSRSVDSGQRLDEYLCNEPTHEEG